MLLSEWIQLRGRGAIQRLAAMSGLHYTTVFPHCHGKPVRTWAAAKRISQATGGEVTIEELCEPQIAEEGQP